MSFKDFLNEKRKVTLKRRYTDGHPALEAGLTARVRNKMIEAVADGKLTQEEFNSILSELSNDSKRWMTRNAKYFNVSEEGITLSRFGKRVLKTFAINENEGFILESTRSQIGIIDKRGVIHSTYVHSDGYPEGVGQMAKDYFSDTKKMKDLLKLGKNGISYLEPGIEGGEGHHFNTPIDGQTVFYGRDRGETRVDMTQKRKLEDLNDYLQDVAHDGAEYVYLWDEKEKEWKYAVAKTKDGRQLGLQVLESELIEEDFVEEGRNAFITAARAAKGKGLKEFEFKGKTFPVTVKDVSEEAPEVEETEEVTENKLVSESFGEFIASLNEETVNEWGTSDSYAMSEVIHYMIRKPKNMPSPFDKKLRDAAESAVDRYWSEWEEYKTNYEGLVDDAVRTYLRHFHREEFKLAQRMFEPVESNSIEIGEDVNEAFKSAKLAQLFNTRIAGSGYFDGPLKGLPSAFYNMANVALDKIEDEDLIDMSPAKAHAITRKDKDNRYVIFYIVDEPKENPYAKFKVGDYVGHKTVPAGLLAIVKGDKFQGMAWGRNSSGQGRTLASSNAADSIGISKKNRDWDKTNLYNPKRISDVADRAIVLDVSVLRDKYSTAGKKADRAAAKKGAIAFKSDKDFRIENMQRYKEIGEDVNEAFKSVKLAQLFNTKVSRSWSSSALKDLPSAFYNMANIALDKVEDEDLIDMSAAEAHAITRKDKDNRYVIFYIVDQQKKNPYADYEGQKTIPAGILSIVKGNNFQGMAWGRNSSGRGRTLVSSEPADSVGISKKYKGWDSTGLYNPKRISEVADRAIVLDISVLRDKYSTAGKKADRAAAKKGAIAFKSDKDFRRENMNRYKEILADKAANLPLDKMVKDAVDSLTLQIQQGLAKGEVENGEPIIGRNSKGRAVKMRDASNHMSQILDNYSNYVRYSNEAQTALTSSSYYEERVKQEAKSIKDRIDKIENMDYAW